MQMLDSGQNGALLQLGYRRDASLRVGYCGTGGDLRLPVLNIGWQIRQMQRGTGDTR